MGGLKRELYEVSEIVVMALVKSVPHQKSGV